MLWVLAGVIAVLGSDLVQFGQLVDAINVCPNPNVNCEDKTYAFRRINGGCNNPYHDTWGIAGQVFSRYVVPGKSNETETLRKSVSGKHLPNPRVISTTIHIDQNLTSNIITNFFSFFGLFVAHDLEKTVVPRSTGCCNRNNQKPCLPIAIPANDSFHGKSGVRCMEFARSRKRKGCIPENVDWYPTIGGRYQYNDNTVYLDLSQIYGSDESTARKLRTFSNGTLKTSNASDGQSLLPTVEQAGMSGTVKGTFAAGDSRVNMFPQLTAIYTIFVLEHNQLAMALHAEFPSRADEWLYQRARWILIQIYQAIIYREYLNVLLGDEQYEKLTVNGHRFTHQHKSLYPSISNENVVAGNRYIYSTISGTMKYGKQKVPLQQTFFNSSYLQAPSGLVRVIQGMLSPAQDFDRFVTAELTNHFLQQKNQKYGLDAVALALQRGRDHISATYVETVKWCSPGVTDIKNFSDLVKYGLMNRSNVDLLKQVYLDPRDIDLFTGSLSEKRIPGAVLGPTLACLQRYQFFSLKFGDRFFYTHATEYADAPNLLPKLRGLVCTNVKGLPDKMIDYPLQLPSDTNFNEFCGPYPADILPSVPDVIDYV